VATTAGNASRDAEPQSGEAQRQRRTPDMIDLFESWLNLGAPLGAPAVGMNVDGHPKVLTGGVDAEANWERFWAARDAVDRQNNPVLQGVELGQGIKTAIETDDCREAGRKIGQLGALVVGTVLMVRDIIPGQPNMQDAIIVDSRGNILQGPIASSPRA
jgi:hypothetical protein